MTRKIKYPELQGKTRIEKQVYYNRVYRNKNILIVREQNRIRSLRHRDKEKMQKLTFKIKHFERGYNDNRIFAKDYYTLEELETR